MSNLSRRGFLGAGMLAALGLAGCATLPANSEPEALRRFDTGAPPESEPAPEPGREPDLLVRDFYAASAVPTSDYATARSYLTESAARQWDPSASTLVVERLDITTQQGGSQDSVSFAITGNVEGVLQPGGSYLPENSSYEASIRVERENGEWRIASLPHGVVIEKTELRNRYEPQMLFFYESSQRMLVGDRRWIFVGGSNMGAALMALIAQGPASLLQPAVLPAMPAEAQFVGVEDDTYTFSGLQAMDQQQRMLLGAQLTWTLNYANIPAPYRFAADGANLLSEKEFYVPDDFAEFNPRISSTAVSPLYALADGNLYKVTGAEALPVEAPLSELQPVESAALTTDDVAAVVVRDGEESVLYGVNPDRNYEEVLRSPTITSPSFEPDSSAYWVVLDGRTIIRVVHSETTGEVSQSEVDSSQLEQFPGAISVLRLSHSGSRAAMLIDGSVYLGVVARAPGEPQAIVNVIDVAPDLAGTALSLAWLPDGSMLVGTANPEAPIWRVEVDGSAVSTLPSANLTAPVVAVASTGTTLYATDTRAALQMPISGTEGAIWREVPGLQGVRAAPIVAR